MVGLSGKYYIPPPSAWPMVGSVALLTLAAGFVIFLDRSKAIGAYVMVAGALLLLWMVFGWFGTVIAETQGGKFDESAERSFRWGMAWFIFSEVMFFGAFFAALFYARLVSVPGLAAPDEKLLWPHYAAQWPTAGPGAGETFTPATAWGVPAINTLILLSSAGMVTWAHWGLAKGRRRQMKLGLALAILLGLTFLGLQTHEYLNAAFTLKTGIYGATFYMLTGFHGAHVTAGTIILIVVLLRTFAGHFSGGNAFAFEAASWYWHFVDVVWLFLFVFVYWL